MAEVKSVFSTNYFIPRTNEITYINGSQIVKVVYNKKEKLFAFHLSDGSKEEFTGDAAVQLISIVEKASGNE
jgi:hypothetical protein